MSNWQLENNNNALLFLHRATEWIKKKSARTMLSFFEKKKGERYKKIFFEIIIQEKCETYF